MQGQSTDLWQIAKGNSIQKGQCFQQMVQEKFKIHVQTNKHTLTVCYLEAMVPKPKCIL